MTSEADTDQPHADVSAVPQPSGRAVAAALSGMAAAWLAAGSIGFMSHPLRHGLAWLALAVALVASWPPRQTWTERLVLVAGLLLAVGMMAPALPVYNVMAVCLVLAMLSRANRGLDQRALLVTALAAAVLGIYLLASTSIPSVWSAADALGEWLGRLAGRVSTRPLWVGATFGGLDFLVFMVALYIAWLGSTHGPRLPRAVYAGVAILGGHLLYLVLLSYSMDLYEALPPAPPPPEFRDYIPPPWSWSDAARSLLPWNVPVLAGLIQVVVAAAMFRWATWLPATHSAMSAGETSPTDDDRGKARQKKTKHGKRRPVEKKNEADRPSHWRGKATVWGPVVLAIVVPLLTTLAPGQSNLAGKKIVAYDRGYLDWEKPVHDSYGQASAGLYGMLPEFVASLGGRFERSSELSQEDLDDADVLLLIHPVHPWPNDRLERIWSFVKGGGSLLVLAETMIQEDELASSFNQVLKRTGMQVRFDAAISMPWEWQQAIPAMSHPAVTGIGDRRNRFGMVAGPSIHARWPARPILVGRCGWSDPGQDSVMTGVYRYDAGERLGDLVLAAEQRCGRGTVVVLADTSSFSNQGNANCYVFTGRLLAYLAGRAGNPQAAWRQVLGFLGCLALLGLLTAPCATGIMPVPPAPTRVAAVALALTLALAGSRTFTHLSMRVLPDGRQHSPYNNVAYIDASHMEAYSNSGWGFDGIAGLVLTLMRNGYQPFLLPELTTERLERAGMFISIAPARPFSLAEQAAVRRFVEGGGIFISMVGADRVGPSQSLLDQFELAVPRSPVRPGEEDREPRPMGNILTLYRPQGVDYDASVLFYTAWPVECEGRDELVRGLDDLPVIALRRVGEGKVVLIGDTAFAMNKNLEYVGGQPFNGRYDNAHFWRWLITFLTEQEDWLPPPKERADAEPAADRPDDQHARDAREASSDAGSPDAPRATGIMPVPPSAGGERPLRSPFDGIPIDEVSP